MNLKNEIKDIRREIERLLKGIEDQKNKNEYKVNELQRQINTKDNEIKEIIRVNEEQNNKVVQYNK